MYKTRPNSKKKKFTNNITKNFPSKLSQLLSTNNKKIQININNFLPYSLSKSRSIVPFSSNTSRNQKSNKLKHSFDNLINNQKSLRNSTIKNKSTINTIIKSKSKSKSKQKKGISTHKPKINNMKNTSYLANNELIKNLVLVRKNNRNKNNIIINNKSQNNNSNLLNYQKKKSNSIRCSLTYINRYTHISKQDKSKLKYDNYICLTSHENNNINRNTIDNKKNKNKKWGELINKFENLKSKTHSLLKKYYTLTENLSNELKMLSSHYEKNIFANSKSYDYRKQILMYDKNDDEQLLSEYFDNKYINTEVKDFFNI